MKQILTALSVSLALCAVAPAQKMGSANTDAPTVSQTLASQSGLELGLEYTSITWADGRAMTALLDKERGQRMRDRVNGTAKSNPLGQLSTDQALKVGGKDLVAGVYALYFTIGDDLQWRLHAQHEEDDSVHHEWLLDLTEEKKHLKRLRMTLAAGEDSAEAEIEIGFGQMRVTIPVQPAAEKDK